VAQRDSADERGPDRDEQKENREEVGESLFVSGEPDANATIVTFQELNGIRSVSTAGSSSDESEHRADQRDGCPEQRLPGVLDDGGTREPSGPGAEADRLGAAAERSGRDDADDDYHSDNHAEYHQCGHEHHAHRHHGDDNRDDACDDDDAGSDHRSDDDAAADDHDGDYHCCDHDRNDADHVDDDNDSLGGLSRHPAQSRVALLSVRHRVRGGWSHGENTHRAGDTRRRHNDRRRRRIGRVDIADHRLEWRRRPAGNAVGPDVHELRDICVEHLRDDRADELLHAGGAVRGRPRAGARLQRRVGLQRRRHNR
jgi:hypothetical protein